MKKFLSVFTIALQVFSSTFLFAGDVTAPSEFSEVRERIVAEVEKGAVPSVAVAVVKDNKIVWAEGFGYANLEKQLKATSDSIYLLASVSKPITATGLMVLKDRGLIDLDRATNEYLPGEKLRAYAGSADQITVRRLANHTGGLPTHYSFFYDGVAPPPMDETIRRWGFAVTAPGTEYNYSNLAFGILNYITEVVSKTPWSQFMIEKVYDPAGMMRTADFVRPNFASDATVQYTRDAAGEFVPVAPYTFDHPGASAIWSSANDLARFLILHMNDGEIDGARILSAESAREMRAVGGEGALARNGVAWGIGPVYGKMSFSHSGGMPGVATIIRGFAEEKCALVVLANADSTGIIGTASSMIAKALFPGAALTDAPNQPPQDDPSTDMKGSWTGRIAHYRRDIPIEIEIESPEKANIRFGQGPGQRRVLESVSIRGDRFAGATNAAIETQESYHGNSVRLAFNLRRDGERLTGTAFATAPGYFGLSFWTELRLQPDLE
jgi:CubicO group peptidase (beta-lactamase class C family)